MQILSGELSWDKLGFQWRRGDLSDHTLNNMKEDGQVSPANSHTVLCDSTLDFDHFNDGQQRNIISCSRAQKKKKKKIKPDGAMWDTLWGHKMVSNLNKMS